MAACLLTITLPSLGTGQQQRPQKPPKLDILLSSAQALPVEYMADIILGALETGAVTDAQWRTDLLEAVFARASMAVQPYRRHDIGKANDTASGRLGAAFNLRLDALSIQCRVVELMLRISPARAREMFSILPAPKAPRLECPDPLVYDVDSYYKTLVDVVNGGFTEAERKQQRDVQFVWNVFRSIDTIPQLVPAARAIRGMHLSHLELDGLLRIYARQLMDIKGGDREFSDVTGRGHLLQEVEALAALSTEPSGAALLWGAYRTFLMTHLQRPRCADNVAVEPKEKRETPGGGEGIRAATAFNKILEQHAAGVSPIDIEQLRPSTVLEGPVIQPLKIDVPKGLLHELILRRNGKPGDREPSQVRTEVADWLDRLERLDETPRECKTCGFHEHASVYITLVDLLNGELQERAIKEYVTFLAGASMQYDDPIEWIAQVQLVLRLTRSANGKDRESIRQYQKEGKLLVLIPHAKDNGMKLLEMMRQTGNQILSLYATAEMLAPRAFTWRG
ncbi:MAG: hypothetical protein IT166_01765 [Bryobacterales bacterium]|nr:hypothetical protein [Bryobacterales bacterium]